ncbi:MAG: response regulator [Actinomycetota bacterium]|nr:response regulator [Actinomycetota bacterium]
MRVLIVDDSDDLRELLETLLTEDPPGWVVAGTAVDGRDAIRKAQEILPDLVLLDASMPVMDGLSALPHLRRAAPAATVVMLSAFPGEQLRQAAIDAGAAGFVEKARMADELVPALERILAAASRTA